MNRRDALKTMVASAGVLPTAQSNEPKYLVRWGKIEEKNGVRYPLGWSVHAQEFEANSESIVFTFGTDDMIYLQDHFVNSIKLAIEQGYRYYFKADRAGQSLLCDGSYRCVAICYVGGDKIRLTFKHSKPEWGYFSPPNM